MNARKFGKQAARLQKGDPKGTDLGIQEKQAKRVTLGKYWG